jgi:hypothetical protein
MISFYLGDSRFRHIYAQQITDLILIINENNTEITEEDYTNSVYGIIFALFKNLRHLTIELPFNNNYRLLSLYKSLRKTCSSSTLTRLCINVHDFNDVVALLDGRLKQLTTFIVQVDHINNRASTLYKMVSSYFVIVLLCFQINLLFDIEDKKSFPKSYTRLIYPYKKEVKCHNYFVNRQFFF